MEEFLLLGQIPGTNIVISFWIWLAIVAAILIAYLAWRLLSQRSGAALTRLVATLQRLKPVEKISL